jgi:hypothetical protein
MLLLALMAGFAAYAAAYAVASSGPGNGKWYGKIATTGLVAPTAPERAGILAAFGDPGAPAHCLTVSLAASNHSYARVAYRGSTSGPCVRWAFNGVNVLRQTAGRWRVLFEASQYACPVPHVPQAIQRDLGICPQRGG